MSAIWIQDVEDTQDTEKTQQRQQDPPQPQVAETIRAIPTQAPSVRPLPSS